MDPACHVLPDIFTIKMDVKRECDGGQSDTESKPLFDTQTSLPISPEVRTHIKQENANDSSCNFEVSFWKLISFTITLYCDYQRLIYYYNMLLFY
jgi:hypothetical protein